MLNTLKRFITHRLRRRAVDPQPSGDGQWANHLTRPAARFLTARPGHEFVIEREVLSQYLKEQLADMGPYLGPERHRVMSEWADPANHQTGLVSDLPYRWRSFNAIAIDLIERGQGQVLCRECERIYRAAELNVERSSWGTEYVTNLTEVQCPSGHSLLQAEARFRVALRRLQDSG